MKGRRIPHNRFFPHYLLFNMRHYLILIAAMLFAAHVYAAPASQQSVEELLVVTKVESAVESMYGGLEQMMRQVMQRSVQGKTLSAQQQIVLDALPAKYVALMREEMNWEKMKPLYVQLYRETFEQDEVDGLIAFYKSAAGQAFVNKMPVVMQKGMVLGQSQMQSMLPKMKAAMDAAMAEAKISD